MSLTFPPIKTPPLEDSNEKFSSPWQRLFLDLYRAIGGGSSGSSTAPTGVIIPYFGTTAPSGYIMFTTGSIGDALSSATILAHANTGDLFGVIWNSFSDSDAAVSGGRGASAISDFNAHKTIALPYKPGRAIGVAGAGTGLTNRTHGATVGVETVILTDGELGNVAHTHTYPAHWHSYSVDIPYHNSVTYSSDPATTVGHNAWSYIPDDTATDTANIISITTDSTIPILEEVTVAVSPSTGHNNVQPTTFSNYIIKL